MTRTSRLAGAVTAGALGPALSSLGCRQPHRRPRPTPADRAGNWLESQLTEGLIHNGQYDFDDFGLTADTGMRARRGRWAQQGRRGRSSGRSPNVDSWTTGVDFGQLPTSTRLDRQGRRLRPAAGADPTDFGGVNLINRLEGGSARRRADRRPRAGQDDRPRLLQHARSGVRRRRAQPGAGPARPTMRRPSCCASSARPASSGSTSPTPRVRPDLRWRRPDRAPDTDATAIARGQPAVHQAPDGQGEAAIADAVGWLKRKQEPNGSFGGGPTTNAPNANSTGLAAWALGQGGKCTAAKDAAGWLAKLPRNNGAVAYDRSALTTPIVTDTQDQWRRATAQAAPGLQFRAGC